MTVQKARARIAPEDRLSEEKLLACPEFGRLGGKRFTGRSTS